MPVNIFFFPSSLTFYLWETSDYLKSYGRKGDMSKSLWE